MRGPESFFQTLAVQLGLTESYWERKFGSVFNNRDQDVDFSSLGLTLIGLVPLGELYSLRTHNRLALWADRTFGQTVKVDFWRVACLDHEECIVAPEEYLEGSFLQKLLH